MHGRARQHRTQPGGEVSDQFGFFSEVGQFSERRNRAPAECSGRKMAVLTVIAAVLAGRSLAAYCLSSATGGASRRIAVSCPCEASRAIAGLGRYAEHRGLWFLFLRARTMFFDCLASLRPSERSESAPPLFADRGSGVERVQSWRVSHRARAEPCRYLARTRRSVGSVTPGCCFCPARSEATRFLLCLTPRLKPSADLNG